MPPKAESCLDQATIFAIQDSRRMVWLGLGTMLLSALFVGLMMTGEVEDEPVAESVDKLLLNTAISQLRDREGTIIVMDPQTGRVRAVVNPEIATEAFAPGSTVKVFTTLAALQSGLINSEARNLCREHYSHEGYETVCSHPIGLAPLNPSEAIAYSCNYYFGRVGERLDQDGFRATLAEFGLGRSSKVSFGRVSSEKLSHPTTHPLPSGGTDSLSAERVKTSLGESRNLQVSPIQLLTAYVAMANGGHLFTGEMRGGEPSYSKLSIDEKHRALIIQGMRGAVRYGTAERAKLHSLPLYVFGKTGTATAEDGYRTHGWFVGFASENASENSPMAPEEIRLGVLVFLKRGQGVEAAELARPIFEQFMRVGGTGETKREDRKTRERDGKIRVHLVADKTTITLALEDYILGVVASEGSTESEIEALKALAVTSRTFALRNLGRHEKDGYDFCATTHCQFYRPLPPNQSRLRMLEKALIETKNEVLTDTSGQPVDSYFSASCGGATANIQTIWGGPAKQHLSGVTDDFCAARPNRDWTDAIRTDELRQALNSDPRTAVGNRLNNILITQHDKTGRAEWISIEGERRRRVRGWDLKIIIGRALGWNVLKSSRFTIVRSESNFIFKGSGLGHGIGLCQEGAHVMAQRGASYRQILRKYFPKTFLTDAKGSLAFGLGSSASLQRERPKAEGQRPKANPKQIASEHFHILYPQSLPEREAEHLLKLLETNRNDLLARLSRAGISVGLPKVQLFVNDTTGDFVGRTGQPPWSAGATRNNRIEVQPLEVLKQRRTLETTLRHELVHVVVDILGRGRAPRWLSEGLALHLAGEGPMFAQYDSLKNISTSELEKKLLQTGSVDEMRATYAAAYFAVDRLIKTEGEAKIWRRIQTSKR